MTNEPSPRPMIAEVVSIGDEMTSGARVDTNAAWLSRRLGELGVTVAFHSTVGDTLDQMVDIFRIAAARADVVVATGGLGPTRDDLTREALAAVVDQPLELRQSALDHIENLFARRAREMPERNRIQAMFPVGSEQIFNPQGTAPGIEVGVPRDEQPDSHIFALPGVPAEMKRMFDDTVAPRILEHAGTGTKIRQLVMKFFGTGESDMESRLGDMISRDRQPLVGITVSTATISLRITATADTEAACEAMLAETKAEILSLVPEFYFGDGEDFEQYHAIELALLARGESMMVIELGHAALLGDWFATLGETEAYRGGVSLAVTGDLKEMFDVNSESEAIDRAREIFSADWVLMVDSYPALDRKSDKPLPASELRLVVVPPEGKALATNTVMGGHPDVLHPRIAKAAMAWMRKILSR